MITHNDLMLRFAHVKQRALHLGWANYTLELEPSSKPGYRVINTLAKGQRRIPFGERYCTAGEMLHFINGYDHAMHDTNEYKERND